VGNGGGEGRGRGGEEGEGGEGGEGEERRREGGKGRAVLYEPYHFSIRSAASGEWVSYVISIMALERRVRR